MRAPVMTKSTVGLNLTNIKRGAFPLVDPRQGDVEDDAASPGRRSLLAIAGSLLVEISLPKLLFAWTVSLLLPAVLLGLTPLVATAWLATVSGRILALTEIGAALVSGRRRRAGMDRMAPSVADRGGQLLVAQRACRPARLCILP